MTLNLSSIIECPASTKRKRFFILLPGVSHRVTLWCSARALETI